jgi:hypothetical protein
MAKQCDHCGKILPSDTIRYCPGCGLKVASSRPAKRSLSEDPPAWMKQLETSLTHNRSNVPLRELNVTVWDEEDTKSLPLPESGVDSVGEDQDLVDCMPTSPLMIASSPKIGAPSQLHSSLPGIDVGKEDVTEELPTNPDMTSVPQNTSVRNVSSAPGIDFDNALRSHDQIEDMPTRSYAAQTPNISHEIEKPALNQQKQTKQPTIGSMHSPVMQKPVTPVLLPQPQFPLSQPVRQTPPESLPVPSLAGPKKNNRKRLAIVFGLLLILMLCGVIAWVILDQPFAVPEITKTTQNFNNTSLGLSLQYPQNWVVDVNKHNGTVSFYDDNHTDQVNITVVVVDNQSMNQYMTETLNALGITGQRTPAALSFAGATWQEIQGSVQQSGANYTATLLFTMHGKYYYTILQLAPSSTYPLEEQLVFSKMRSSFQF